MTLYELTEQYRALQELAEDPETPEDVFNDTMEGLDGEIEIKAESYGKVIRHLEGEVELMKSEEARISKKRKAIENSITRIKANLEKAMRATGKTKIKTELFSFGIQKNPASLKLAQDLDFNTIPAEFLRFLDPEIDKAKVKEALKNGEELSWAHMEQSESLRIK